MERPIVIVVVNGKKEKLERSHTVQEALVELGYEDTYFAVAVNEEFVPKLEYTRTPLKEGDRLEVLSPIRGG